MAAPACSEPRVRVAAVMFIEDKVLLVRQSKGGTPYYLLPGGGVRLGETLESALIREVAEETGLQCEVGELLLVNDTIAPDASRHVVNVTLEARPVGGEVIGSPVDPAIEALEFVELDALAGLDLRPPIATQLLAVLQSRVPKYVGAVWTDDRT